MTRHSVNDRDELLRQLRQVKAGGIAFSEQEAQLSVSCTAAPILVRGSAVAAISVSLPTAAAGRTQIEG